MKARLTATTDPMLQSDPLDSVASIRFYDRISNLSSSLDTEVLGSSRKDSLNVIWFLLFFDFEGAFYGGLHFTAWSRPFPSDLQAFMWHAACVTTMSTGLLIVLTVPCFGLYEWVTTSKWWVRFGKSSFFISLCIEVSVDTLGIASFVVLSLWYVICRVFLVIECFILLA